MINNFIFNLNKRTNIKATILGKSGPAIKTSGEYALRLYNKGNQQSPRRLFSETTVILVFTKDNSSPSFLQTKIRTS